MLSANLARESVISELVYADNLVVISETFQRLMNNFRKLKESFGSKCLKVNLGKTEMMVTKNGLAKSKDYRC